MSQRRPPKRAAVGSNRARASIFAALGDITRLNLFTALSLGAPRSISELSADARITRQAITKHLRILESAGLVSAERQGREVRFRFVPEPVREASHYLADVTAQWDEALARLKTFVETENE